MKSYPDIEFQPSRARMRDDWFMRVVVPTVAIVGGVAAFVFLVYGALTGDNPFLNLVLVIAIYAVVGPFLYLISAHALHVRSNSVRHGTVSLGYPIRRASGGRKRTFHVSELVDAKPEIGRGGYIGATFLLSDGTRFFIEQSAFEGRGLEIMNKLCRLVGKSYESEVKAILVQGRRYRFHIARLRGVRNHRLVFAQRIRTETGNAIRELAPDDVQSWETVSTPYAGPTYLVTMMDGTWFLITEAEAKSVGFPDLPGWAGKGLDKDSGKPMSLHSSEA